MKKYQNFLSENFRILAVKFSVYMNRRVFVMWRIFNATDVLFLTHTATHIASTYM